MGQHRSDYKCDLGRSSTEILKHGGAYIELIEKFPCKDKEELLRREGEVIRATLNTVNKQLPGRTHKEYRDNNRVEKKQYDEIYHQENRGTRLVKMKQYRVDNKENIKQRVGTKIRCECGANTTRSHLPRHKRTNLHKAEMFILELADEL